LTVIAREAKQSPSAELGVASSLLLLTMTDFATTLLGIPLEIDKLGFLDYTTSGPGKV
jgi:hypothetical protein